MRTKVIKDVVWPGRQNIKDTLYQRTYEITVSVLVPEHVHIMLETDNCSVNSYIADELIKQLVASTPDESGNPS